MRKPPLWVVATLGFLAFAVGAAPDATAQVPVTIEDGEFLDADWQLTVFTIGGGGTVQVVRRVTGGNPGAFRLMQHENGTGGGAARNRVVGVHRNLGANYDPGTDGAIPCLDYAEDARLYAGGGDGQSTGPVVWQSGRVFTASAGVTGAPATWRRITRRGLTALDFMEWRRDTGSIPDSHPDFSASGATIGFGYFRSNTDTLNPHDVGIDNWTITLCAAPPTSTPTPSPTRTATQTELPPTETATAALATQTPTPSPSATFTPHPEPIFLPIALHEKPCTIRLQVDVALVIDASMSMAEPAGDGRTKIEAARDAVGGFLDLLDWPAGDQASVISFNSEAKVDQRLTDDIALLRLALATLEVRPETRIASSVFAAHEELGSARHRASNLAVIVLLTDGFANPDPPHLAVEAAELAKTDGIEIFTIGLGPTYDEAGLRSMASGPTHFFAAARAEDLAYIYRGIARTLPGPVTCYWGRR